MNVSVAQQQREILCKGYTLRMSYSNGMYEVLRVNGELIRAFYGDTFERAIESVYRASVSNGEG